jgi:hypothetical protein
MTGKPEIAPLPGALPLLHRANSRRDYSCGMQLLKKTSICDADYVDTSTIRHKIVANLFTNFPERRKLR